MAQEIATSGIVGQAFTFLRLSGISTLGEESDEAGVAAGQYSTSLRACLEMGDWSFASTIAYLPEVDAVASGAVLDPILTGLYARPADLVRLRQVGEFRGTRYRLDEDYLRTDTMGQLYVRYTRMIDDESKATASFRMLVSAQLAVDLSLKINKSDRALRALQDQQARWRVEALRTDRTDHSPVRDDGQDDCYSADWVQAALR